MLPLKYTILPALIFLYSTPGIADDVATFPERTLKSNVAYFDPVFLNIRNADDIDLSRFNQGAGVLPGTYPADIYVNDLKVGHENVIFVEQPDKSIPPCLSRDSIKKINLNYDILSAGFSKHLASDQSCFYLQTLLPQATVSFDSGAQRLDISIPQAYMQDTPRGYVSPELWDSGVPAAFLGYMLNGYSNHSRGQTLNSAFGGINSGINLDTWYFRHDGNYSWQEKGLSNYQSLNTYVQRDVPAIQGRLLGGQASTRGQLFDTLPFRGAELFNVNQMLPESKRGYAPDIRGVARTSARVTIRQNRRVIYEKGVPPGAFQVTDLFPSGYGGNLDVTVTEANGDTQNFQVPYASVSQLLRPGMHSYDVVVGKLDDKTLSTQPALYQATYQRGLSNWLTGYIGLQGSQDYYAFQVGTAISTPIGALMADVTQARTQLSTESMGAQSGQSYQFSYSKYIHKTSSNLTLAAYRYSTAGYMDYLTAMHSLDAEKKHQNPDNIRRTKNKFSVTLNQGLPEQWGQLYLTGYTQNYWNQGQSDLQYQIGYSNNYRTLNYNLSAGRVRNGVGNMETSLLFSMTMPLGSNEQRHVPQLTVSLSHNSNGRTGEQVGVSGTTGADDQFSYGATGTHYNQSQGGSLVLDGQYRSPYTTLLGSYGAGLHYQSSSVGITGTLLAWQGGLVMTPYTSNTFAIVDAPGAAGAKVSGYSGIKVDPWGHAAVPYLNAYEMNEVVIDPRGISFDVELQATSQRVAPHAGAVVVLKYATQKGYPLLIAATQNDGTPLPFGADVLDSKGNAVGAVGQMGQIYARVQHAQGELQVKWGNDSEQQCHLDYQFIPEDRDTGLIRTQGQCRQRARVPHHPDRR